jgi:hypothetical protein
MINPPLRTVSWFYHTQGDSAYQIAERVRLTLWDARIYNFWLDVTRATAPMQMRGNYADQPAEINWQPGEWLNLRLQSSETSLVDTFSYVLGFKPSLCFIDADNYNNWEWHLKDTEQRWHELSGNPVYQAVKRL